MDITPQLSKGKQMITGYGVGGFKINGEFVAGSQIIFPDRVLALNAQTMAQITLGILQPILDVHPVEILLIGTGKTMQPIDPVLRAALKAQRIACDSMDTGAACRTYNVLMSEERKVAAALIAV